MSGRCAPTDRPRRDEIEAAIAAYNSADRERFVLPPEAARLLVIMFPRDTVCRCSVTNLATTGGFDRNAVRKLLISLAHAGFLTKEGPSGTMATYHLHLPPRRRR
jgi:hypothetical protein